MHKTGDISDRPDKKPSIILDYNNTKGAVDTLDMCVHTYTCARQTRMWPMIVFFNVIDIAAWNSCACWISCNPNWNIVKRNSRRRQFLIELATALIKSHMTKRWSQDIQSTVRNRIKACGLINTLTYQQIPMLHLMSFCVRCARCRGQDVLLVISLCVQGIWETFVISVFESYEKVFWFYLQYMHLAFCLISFICIVMNFIQRYTLDNMLLLSWVCVHSFW